MIFIHAGSPLALAVLSGSCKLNFQIRMATVETKSDWHTWNFKVKDKYMKEFSADYKNKRKTERRFGVILAPLSIIMMNYKTTSWNWKKKNVQTMPTKQNSGFFECFLSKSLTKLPQSLLYGRLPPHPRPGISALMRYCICFERGKNSFWKWLTEKNIIGVYSAKC